MAFFNLKRGLILIVAIAFAVAIFLGGEGLLHRDLKDAANERLRAELHFLAGRLSAELAASEHLGRGFAAVISAKGGMERNEFNEACQQLMANEPKIRNIALVIGSIITYNCPESENGGTIGSDLKTRPDQWRAFERMIQSGQPDISGPVNLVQGGWAVIARTPIMIRGPDGTSTYLGALSIPLRIEGLLSESGITTAATHLDIAIRGNRNASLAPEILFGDPAVFTGEPVTAPIAFPDGDWQLAGISRLDTRDDERHHRQHMAVLGGSILGGLLVLVGGLYLDRRGRLEAESKRNRDLLRAFMENSPIAMYVKDLKGRYIDLNAEARIAFNVGDQPYVGASATDYFPPDLARSLAADDSRVKAGEVIRNERASPPGSNYDYEREIKFPVLDESGKVIAIGGYVIDASASKQAELRLTQALRHAEMANRAKSEFLATMSHELRTPLNAIIGFSDVMKSEMFGPLENAQYLDYVAKIHQSGTHLADLLGGIIDLSAVESGHLEVKSEVIVPAEALKDCRVIVESLAREYRHELVFADSASGTCRGDRRLLRQVLLNLASNAAKYTRKGGRIKLATENRNDRIVFRVSDNGIGMAPADIERALQPFTRLGDAMRAEVGGSGIGLTLVKRLTEVMGGTLTITSELGRGTTVEIALPRA